jgi:hypothetical protein
MLVTCTAFLAVAAGARAEFHLMKIREVYPDASPANADYLELQMYASGQDRVANHVIAVYSAGGAMQSYLIPHNAVATADQSSILFGGAGRSGDDFNDPKFDFDPAGGAVCIDAVEPECVSWGSFSGALPAPGATPFKPGGTIATGKAIRRTIAPGCSTLLQEADDTNLGSDWEEVDPNPRRGTDPVIETPCQLSVAVSGLGRVTGGGLACPPVCSLLFFGGELVTLTPQGTGGSTFAGWGGDCAAMGVCTLDLSRAHGVTATFTGGASAPGNPPASAPPTSKTAKRCKKRGRRKRGCPRKRRCERQRSCRSGNRLVNRL